LLAARLAKRAGNVQSEVPAQLLSAVNHLHVLQRSSGYADVTRRGRNKPMGMLSEQV
jgi:hypothetical protein